MKPKLYPTFITQYMGQYSSGPGPAFFNKYNCWHWAEIRETKLLYIIKIEWRRL